MSTLKFSQFVNGGTIKIGSKVVGLGAGTPATNTIFDFPGAGIADANGSHLIGWNGPISGVAVNYVQISNALTGNAPKLAAMGSDVNVDIEVASQGSNGVVKLTPGANGYCQINSTGALLLASGTSAERPVTGIAGMIRYNLTIDDLEYYSGTTWNSIADASGSVSSVSGTANRITSTGGNTPVIDISPVYVGQSSITTLGTIGVGVWQGTTIDSSYGGTGVNNGGRTFTILGGNISLTAPGAVSLTLPASGTLVSNAVTNNYGFNVQNQMQIKDYTETLVALGNVSGAVNLDLSAGNVFSAVLTGATTFTATNVPASGSCASISLFLTNGTAGVTWMTGTIWPSATAPTLTAGKDVLVFCTLNGGTTWYGNLAGINYA